MVIPPLPKTVRASDIPPERLAGAANLSEQEKIAEASRQFEAVLLRQILSASQKTLIPSKFADNSTASEIYRDMVTNQLADSISKSGTFGLAQTFENQLAPRAHVGLEEAPAIPGNANLPSTTISTDPRHRPHPATYVATPPGRGSSDTTCHHSHERTVE